MANYFYKPIHWRMRADMTRTIANGMPFGESRKGLMHIAEEYERIAARMERELHQRVDRELRQCVEPPARVPQPSDDMTERLMQLQRKFQRVGR